MRHVAVREGITLDTLKKSLDRATPQKGNENEKFAPQGRTRLWCAA